MTSLSLDSAAIRSFLQAVITPSLLVFLLQVTLMMMDLLILSLLVLVMTPSTLVMVQIQLGLALEMIMSLKAKCSAATLSRMTTLTWLNWVLEMTNLRCKLITSRSMM
jgi:hypothetical protein